MRVIGLLLATALVATACGNQSADRTTATGELPPTSPAQMEELLAASDRPVVLNVWASWCIPCRSEAPLLRAAHESLGDRVRFIGVDVADDQGAAQEFIAEFGITFENYFDPDRSIPASLSRTGVPLTFFFRPGGELSYAHPGVIDERTLALHIDELLAG